jgi:GT2 family glycosyltransferase
MTSIIVPSRFPDIFEACRASLWRYQPDTEKLLVRDGHDIIDPYGWTTIQAPDGPFVYSRNVNLGINQTSGDVLLTNDDVKFVQAGTIERMEEVLALNPEVGILSPRIDGGVGNELQANIRQAIQITPQRLAFVCVLIRRKVIEDIGLLDERFDGYGAEDTDYCRRAVNAGWRLGVTADAVVQHGHGRDTWSSSYRRVTRNADHLSLHASQKYFEKWGDYRFENFNRAKNGLVQDWFDTHPGRPSN